jgi:hypothetical protein
VKRRLAVVAGLGVVGVAAVAAFVLLSSEPNPVKEAAEITGHQRGADLLVSGEVMAGSDRRSVRGDGHLDLRGNRARLYLGASAPGLEDARGEGTISILVGSEVFERRRWVHDSPLPPGKRWLRRRLTGAVEQGDGTALVDPRRLLRALHEATDVEKVGPEAIRGTPATRYRATVELDGREVPVAVWIDRDGLVLREDLRVRGASFSVFFDYRERPRIAEPSARFVVAR